MSLLHPTEPFVAVPSQPALPLNRTGQVAPAAWAPAAAAYEDEPRTLALYWSLIGRNKWIVVAATLAGALAGAAWSLTMPRLYRARTVIEVQGLNEDFLNMRNVTPTAMPGSFQSPEYNTRTQASVLRSRPVVERALARPGLEQRYAVALMRPSPLDRLLGRDGSGARPDRGALVSAAQAGLRVRPEASTRAVEVTFDSPDPAVGADFVNALTESLIEVGRERRWNSSQATSDWLARQLEDVKRKLTASEDSLQRYTRESSLTITSDRENIEEASLKQVREELLRAQAERIARQARYEQASTARPDSLPEVLTDSTLNSYQVELAGLRKQKAELASILTPEHPKMEKVDAQIAAMESELEKSRANIIARIQSEFESAKRREALLARNYQSQHALLVGQNAKIGQYSTLKHEVDATRLLYDSLFQKVKEAGLASAMNANDVSVIEPALPPSAPFRPNTPLNSSFGMFTGFCLGCAAALGRARADHRIGDPGETSQHLCVPELGVIPRGLESSAFARLLGRGAEPNPQSPRLELVTVQDTSSPMAESFRLTLASLLLASQGDPGLRVIAFTSANPGEGKTTVITNLAAALARIGRRVLLIDGDLRKPRLHSVFQLDNKTGLSDVLLNGGEAAILETGVPNLSLLTSGSSSDETVMFTSSLGGLLDGLRPSYDMILIDTPPLLHLPDARMISRNSDAAILVVAQHTTREVARAVQQRLLEDGSRLLGTILNNYRSANGKSYTSYYYKA